MRLHEIFEDAVLVIETGGVGRVIPGVNTTVDVGPDEVKKQAKKWKFKVSRDGVPPQIRSDGKIKR
jgi:hypothetical protein